MFNSTWDQVGKSTLVIKSKFYNKMTAENYFYFADSYQSTETKKEKEKKNKTKKKTLSYFTPTNV